MILLGGQYIVKIFFCQPFVKNFAKKEMKGGGHGAGGNKAGSGQLAE
jgi:hypothetical protein